MEHGTILPLGRFDGAYLTPTFVAARLAAAAAQAGSSDYHLNPGTGPKPGAALTQAAVLVPLVRHEDGLTVLLTRRTDHLAHHAGQIAFPGGRREPEDPDAIAAALRETHEELGIPPARVTVIGTLGPYVTSTGYEVIPVVGLLDPPVELAPDPHEVADAFEVPLAFLVDPANHQRHFRDTASGERRHFYAMPWGERYIWGATAGMLVSLARLLAPPEPGRRIAPPAWLTEPAILGLCRALGAARFVGGAVRDTLLGRAIGDLDLATPLPPAEVMARAARAGFRAVPTGLDHGTVTVLAGTGKIEVTTLRRDVETDGRHAVVAFTRDWAADAARRDFTMNALYLDDEGGVWDPLGQGIEDCLAGRVRFVGDPAARIAEDRLRALRFYRFQAHYGREPADPAARAAASAAADKLDLLSGERVRDELLKLLSAADPVPVLHLMRADGVLDRLLPGAASLDRLAALIPVEPAIDPLRRLAALLPGNAAPMLAERLKLANRERDRLLALTASEPTMVLGQGIAAQRRLIYRLGTDIYLDRVLLQTGGQAAGLAELARSWSPPVLPVGGADVLALGVAPGKRVGALLAALEAWWIDEDFRPDRARLLDRLAALAGGAE